MTILITGATGLVGERLLPRLVAEGRSCRALVRAGRTLPPGVAAVEGDLLDPASLAAAVDGVSAIIHLAAVFRTPDDALIWRSNRDGTANLIAAAQAHAPQVRFIMTSTSHVYAPDAPRPGREDDGVAPEQAYPASKVAAERALRASGLTWAILRLPFVYGDGDGHLEALPGHVRDTWHPARRLSTMHHRDVAGAMALALSGAMDGRIVNLADEAPLSAHELLGIVGVDMAPSSAPLANPWHMQVDGSLARRLGFRPTVRSVRQAVEEDIL